MAETNVYLVLCTEKQVSFWDIEASRQTIDFLFSYFCPLLSSYWLLNTSLRGDG